jgi:sugar/nucleoside kinase (ribokinase family)
MRIAKEGGAVLSYDPNLRLPLWPSAKAAKEGIKSIWDHADIIKVSDEEVKFLTGGDPSDDENNLTLFHPGCKLMLVTEGGEGCRYYTPVCQKSIPYGAISDHLVRFPCSCRRAVLNILLLFSFSIW